MAHLPPGAISLRVPQSLQGTKSAGLRPWQTISSSLRPAQIAVLHQRPSDYRIQARRSKQDDWRDEDFVELDDEPDWQEVHSSLTFNQSTSSPCLPIMRMHVNGQSGVNAGLPGQQWLPKPPLERFAPSTCAL